MDNSRHHILLITYPAQGHINPSLQLAKRLTQMGLDVTFTTSVSAYRRMPKTATKGLRYAPFSDGYDDGIKNLDDTEDFMSKLRSSGTQSLQESIIYSAKQENPITYLIYTIFFPWAAEVAHSFQLPSALFWIQPAAVLDIYYYYFNGYQEAIHESINDPLWSIKLPGLPLLCTRELPSFLFPAQQEIYTSAIPLLKEHFDVLNADSNSKVLVNSFNALENDALKAINNLNLIAIGPVIPSAFLDDNHSSDTSVGGDLFQNSREYIEWLNTKEDSSVIYVSFGSMLVLTKSEMEEIGRGLLKSGRPFLWVVRKKEDQKDEERLSCMEKLEEQGMIVSWCSQIEVLSHKAVGCFVTHCGWNSTLESLCCGVPMVGLPRWTDQGTNAKMIEDVWKTGVRVKENEEGIVEGDEIYRCLEMVMGESGEELRKNAKNWKALARDAAKEGGTSYNNLKTFVQEIRGDGF